MITIFNSPEPEEIFISVCARIKEDMLFSSESAAIAYLFGMRQGNVAVDLPYNLSSFVEALPLGHHITVDYIIEKHTLLPFYAPFLSPDYLKSLREAMSNKYSQSFQTSKGISSTLVSNPMRLRYCACCFKEDQERLGFAYWHRVHQLPGIYVCPDHAVWLEESNIPFRKKYGDQLSMLTEPIVERQNPRLLEAKDIIHQMYLVIASNAAFLLNSPQVPSPEGINRRYMQLLAKQGFASYGGKTDWAKLIEAFQKTYPVRLLSSWGLSLDSTKSQNWLTIILRSRNQALSPICHLLLMQFLDITPQDFFAMSDTIEHFGESPWPCLNPVCSNYYTLCISVCDIEYRSMVRGRPVGIFKCDCGYVYSRIGPDETPDARWIKTRVEAYGSVWETALRQAWLEPNKTIRGIARRFGTSRNIIISQANRLGLLDFNDDIRIVDLSESAIVSNPSTETISRSEELAAYKEAWINIVQENPNAGATLLSRMYRTLYEKLRRYDREWLAENTPRKPHNSIGVKHKRKEVYSEKRDRVFAKLIRRAAKRIKQQPDAPVRVTRTRLAYIWTFANLRESATPCMIRRDTAEMEGGADASNRRTSPGG